MSNITFIFEDSEEKSTLLEDYKTWTITFSESVENHAGMQQIGKQSKNGISISDLDKFQSYFEKLGCDTENIDLSSFCTKDVEVEKAQVLIVRNGVKMLCGDEFDEFVDEVKNTEDVVDTKAWMRGRVVNKLARYNLCYADESQSPNYDKKEGTILSFNSTPFLSKIRKKLGNICGDKYKNLFAELNYYYDNRKCGIGFHGDSERRIVIGLRIGSSMNLQYQWFHKGEPIGNRIVFNLNHGDLYFMSEKAVGTDWKKRLIPTLRHAAGCKKFTTISEK